LEMKTPQGLGLLGRAGIWGVAVGAIGGRSRITSR
jgi:hypothetical protein